MPAVAELVRQLPDLTANEATQWVAATLAQAAALRQHDGRLYPLDSVDPAVIAAAETLHQAWREWADEAAALLRRIVAPHTAGATPDVRELQGEVAHARALGGMPFAKIRRRWQQVESGEMPTYTIEEVRRELGLAPRR